MNFLKAPPARLTPNSDMDAAGLEAAREFVDELILLGVFREIDEGMEVLSNAPLFVVPKPGQPGQWQYIADMKVGGQNNWKANCFWTSFEDLGYDLVLWYGFVL